MQTNCVPSDWLKLCVLSVAWFATNRLSAEPPIAASPANVASAPADQPDVLDEKRKWLISRLNFEHGEQSLLKAIRQLPDFGVRSAPAIPKLVELMHSNNVEVQWAATDALAKVGVKDEGALAALQDAALHHGESYVRGLATDELPQLGFPASKVLPTLIDATKDVDPQVRSYAVAAIGMLGESAAAAVPMLISMLSDRREVYYSISNHASSIRPLRCYAAVALGRIGPPAKAARCPLLKILRTDDNNEARVDAALALYRIVGKRDEWVTRLIHLARSKRGGADDAIAALGEMGPDAKKAVPMLVGKLREKDPILAVEALGQIGKDAAPALPALERLANKPPDDPTYYLDIGEVKAAIAQIRGLKTPDVDQDPKP